MRLRSVKFTVADRHFAQYRGPYFGNANGRVLVIDRNKVSPWHALDADGNPIGANTVLIDASGYGSTADITVYRDLGDAPGWLFVLSMDRHPYELISLGAFTVEDTYTAGTYPDHSHMHVPDDRWTVEYPQDEEFLVNQREIVVTESDYGTTHSQDLFGKPLHKVMDFRTGYAEFTIARKLKWFMDETGS